MCNADPSHAPPVRSQAARLKELEAQLGQAQVQGNQQEQASAGELERLQQENVKLSEALKTAEASLEEKTKETEAVRAELATTTTSLEAEVRARERVLGFESDLYLVADCSLSFFFFRPLPINLFYTSISLPSRPLFDPSSRPPKRRQRRQSRRKTR